MKVSWQVTGVRQDPYAEAHRIQVEEDKPQKERGLYLHPELYGQPKEKGIEYAHRPAQPPEPKVRSQKSAVAQAGKKEPGNRSQESEEEQIPR